MFLFLIYKHTLIVIKVVIINRTFILA